MPSNTKRLADVGTRPSCTRLRASFVGVPLAGAALGVLDSGNEMERFALGRLGSVIESSPVTYPCSVRTYTLLDTMAS
jgi:hypothetical protein